MIAEQVVQPVEVDVFRGLHPLPTQARFLDCGAPRKAYIGPFGSGKTEVLTWQAILLSHFYTPNRGMICRYTFRELKDTTRRRFMEIADPALVQHASLPETGDGYVEWKIGGVTLFRNLEGPLQFGSLDLGYCGIDEGAECPSSVFQHIEGRVGRHWKSAGISPGKFPYSPLYVVGNPGGQDYLWKLFFKPNRTPEMQVMYRGFQPEPRENEANLPPGYYTNLARGKAEWWIKRFLKGDMRSLEGLVWPQFDFEENQVRPFTLPADWRRVMGLDHGRRNPTAALWTAVDPWANLIGYREYEVSGPTPHEHARSIMRLDRNEMIDYRVADPSMFAKNQARGDKWHSIAEEYAEAGMELQQGDNAMQASLDRVGQLLWADPQHTYPPWHPKAGQKGSPRLFFFNTLERTIEEVSSWKFKDFRQEGMGLREEPVDVDDHLCDCLRYIATSFPEASVEARPVVEPTRNQWQADRIKRASRALRRAAMQEDSGYDQGEEYV